MSDKLTAIRNLTKKRLEEVVEAENHLTVELLGASSGTAKMEILKRLAAHRKNVTKLAIQHDAIAWAHNGDDALFNIVLALMAIPVAPHELSSVDTVSNA